MNTFRRRPMPGWLLCASFVGLASACTGGAVDGRDPNPTVTIERSIAGDPSIDVDGRVQQALEREIDRLFPNTEGRFGIRAVVVDVAAGKVVASAAQPPTPGFLNEQRRSGSTLKLVVAIAAAEAGVLPDDGIVAGLNCQFPDGTNEASDSSIIAPTVMSVADATADSVNCAYAKLAREIGPDRLAATAGRVGLSHPLDVTTRFATGANTVSMIELATVATALAIGGRAVAITDASASAVVSEHDAAVVAALTRDVLTSGTAAGRDIGRPAVAKTGTSANNTDAWIVGATPQFAMVVWVGNPNAPDDSMANEVVPGFEKVRGGNLPANVWAATMRVLHEDLPILDLPQLPPSTRDQVIVVDRTVDCSDPGAVRTGGDGPSISWIPLGDVAC
jgi:membrane peptidoglycan carboxypeptidase